MEEMEAVPEALPLDDGTLPNPQANGLDQRGKGITPVISSESCLKSVEPPDSPATLSLNGQSKEDHHLDGGGSSQEMPMDSPMVEEREPSSPGHSAELGDKTASDFSASDTNRDRGGDSEDPSDVVPSVEARTVGHARLFEDNGGEKGEEGLNSPAERTEGRREEDLRFDASDSQPEGPPPQELYPDAEVNGGRETLEPTEGDHGDKQEDKCMGDVYSTVISPQRVQRQPSPMNTCSLEDEMEQVEQKEEAKRKKQERRSQLLMSAGVMLQGTAPTSANSTLEDSSPTEPAPVSPPEGSTPSPETASAKIQDGGDISSNGEGERDAPSQESGVTSGRGRTTEDRNLEELSEILLDSDSDSNGNSSRLRAAHETNSSRTAGKRVSFADEVREIRSGAVEKKLSEDGRGDLRAIAGGCSQATPTKTPSSLPGVAQGGEQEVPRHPGVPVSPSPTSPRRPTNPKQGYAVFLLPPHLTGCGLAHHPIGDLYVKSTEDTSFLEARALVEMALSSCLSTLHSRPELLEVDNLNVMSATALLPS